MQEALHFGVEGRTSQDDFFKIAAKGADQFGADLLFQYFVQDGQAEEETVFLQDGFEFGFIDFFDNQRNGDDDARVNLCEGLHDDFRAGDARKEMHVGTERHLEEEFEHHTVHVGRREHGDNFAAGFDMRLGQVGEGDVRGQGPVGNHDAFGETGGPGGVVDQGQLVGGILIIIQVFGTEVVGIFLAEALVEVLADLPEGVVLGVEELERVDLDNHVQTGHLLGAEAFPDDLVHEEDLGVRVVHQVVDIAGFELVEERNGNGAIGEGCQKTHAPVGLVAGADGHFVSFFQTALFKGDVQFGHTARHIFIC